jgi:hypothetical protein
MIRSSAIILSLVVLMLVITYSLGFCRKNNPNHLETLQQSIPKTFLLPLRHSPIIHSPRKVLNREENYFMMALFRWMEIFPVHPATSR